MNQTKDDKRQDYVVGLVNQINRVLDGEDNAEVATALTLAVACNIVATTDDQNGVMQSARGFAKHLAEFVGREDIVQWIKHGTTFIPPTVTGRRQ
jgi:hypothetical protein